MYSLGFLVLREKSLEDVSQSRDLVLKIDNDVVKFLKKRKKYMEQLKKLSSSMDIKFEFLDGMIKMTKGSASRVKDWRRKCNDSIKTFLDSFQKKSFPFDNETRESMCEPLITIQNKVSSSGAACWLDEEKLILVSNVTNFDQNVKDVDEFVRKANMFSKKSFEVDDGISDSIVKELPQLEEILKSHKITLNEKELVVVGLKSDFSHALKTVNAFLGRLKLAGITA